MKKIYSFYSEIILKFRRQLLVHVQQGHHRQEEQKEHIQAVLQARRSVKKLKLLQNSKK